MESKFTSEQESVDRLKQRSPLKKIVPQLSKPDPARLVTSSRVFRRRHRGARHIVSKSPPHAQKLSCAGHRFHSADVHHAFRSTPLWSDHVRQAGLIAALPRFHQSHDAWRCNEAVVQHLPLANEQQGPTGEACTVARQTANAGGRSDCEDLRQQCNSLLRAGVGGAATDVQEAGERDYQEGTGESTAEGALIHRHTILYEKRAATRNRMDAQREPLPCPNPAAVTGELPSAGPQTILRMEQVVEGEEEQAEAQVKTAGRKNETGQVQTEASQTTLLSLRDVSLDKASRTTLATPSAPQVSKREEARHAPGWETVLGYDAGGSLTDAGEEAMMALRSPCSSKLPACSGTCSSAYSRDNTLESTKASVFPDEGPAVRRENAHTSAREVSPAESTLPSACASSANSLSSTTQKSKQISNALRAPPDTAASPVCRNGDVAAFKASRTRHTSLTCSQRRIAEEAEAPTAAFPRVNSAEEEEAEGKYRDKSTISGGRPQQIYDRSSTTIGAGLASDATARPAALDFDGTTERGGDSNYLRNSDGSTGRCSTACMPVLEAGGVGGKKTPAAAGPASSCSSGYFRAPPAGPSNMTGSRSTSRSRSLSSRTAHSSEGCGCGTRRRQCASAITEMTDTGKSARLLSSEELRTTSPLSWSSVCCCCDCCSASIVVTTASAPQGDHQHAPLYPLPPAPLTFSDRQGECMSGKPGWYGHNYPLFRSTRIQKCGLLYWRWRRGQIRASALVLLLLQEAIKQLLFTVKVALSLCPHTLQDSGETSRRQAQRPHSSSAQQRDKNSDSLCVQAESRIRDQLLLDIGMHQQQLPHVCAAYFCRGTSSVRATSRGKGSHGSRNGVVSDAICEHCRHSPSVTQEFRESEYHGQICRGTRPAAAELQQGKRRRERNYTPESLKPPTHGDTAGSARGSKRGVKREEKEGHRESELSTTVVSTSGAEKEGRAALRLTGYQGGTWLYREEAAEQSTQESCRCNTRKRACSSRPQLTQQGTVPATAADVWRPDELLSGRCSPSFHKTSRSQKKEGTEERAHVQGNEGHKLHKESLSAGIRRVLSPIRLRLLRVRRATRFPIVRSVVQTCFQNPPFSLCQLCRRRTLSALNLLLKWRLCRWLLHLVRLLLQLPQRRLRQGPLWLVAESFREISQHQVRTLGARILEVIAREGTNHLGVAESDMRVRVKFVILLLVMYPFIHGVYIPCLALIWFVRRVYDACWWFCATRCCNCCTSTQQLHRWRSENQVQQQQRSLQLQALLPQIPRQRPRERSPRHHKPADGPQEEQHQHRQKKEQGNKNSWKQQQQQKKQEASKKTRRTQPCGLEGCERQGRSGQQGQRHSEEYEQQQRLRLRQEEGDEREAAEQRFQQQPTQCRSLFSQVQWLSVLLRKFVRRHTRGARRLSASEELATPCQEAAENKAGNHALVVQSRRLPLLQRAYGCCILPALRMTRALGFPSSPLLSASPSNEAAGNSNPEAYATPFENTRCIRVIRRVAAAVKKFTLSFRSNNPCMRKLEAVSVAAFKSSQDVLGACTGHNKLTRHTCTEAEGLARRILSLTRWSLTLTAVLRGFLFISKSLQGSPASVKRLLLHGLLPSATLGARWPVHTGKLVEWLFSLGSSLRGNRCNARGRKGTEILNALNGQELFLYSQPHVVVCAVGYTEKLTREELLQVVRRKLLVQREETRLSSQQPRKEEEEGDPGQTHQREAKRRAQHEPEARKKIEGTATREKKPQQEEDEEEERGEEARQREEEEEKKKKEVVEEEWRRQAGRGAETERPCPAEETVSDNSSEDEALPLLCFKHPRLRAAVRKVLHRYCWVRDENFSAARHVVSLNRQQVLALLELHQGQQSPTDLKTFEENLLRRRQACSSQRCPACCCARGGREKQQVQQKEEKMKACLRSSGTAVPAPREETGENKDEEQDPERKTKETGEAGGAKGGSESKGSSRRRLRSPAGRTQTLRSTRHLSGESEKDLVSSGEGRGSACERFSGRRSRAAAVSHCSCSRPGDQVLERYSISKAPLCGCRGDGEHRDAERKSGRDVLACKSCKNSEDQPGETPSNAGAQIRCIPSSRETEETQTPSDVEMSHCCSSRRRKGGADCSDRNTFERRSSSTNCSWTGDVKQNQDGCHGRTRASLRSSSEDGKEAVFSGRGGPLSENRCRSPKEERGCSKGKICNCVVRREEAQALVTLLASQSLPPALPLWQFVLLESVELPLQEQAASAESSFFPEQTSASAQPGGCGSLKSARIPVAAAAAEAESHSGCRQGGAASAEEQPCASRQVNAAAATIRDSKEVAALQCSRAAVATQTRKKKGSSHSVRRRVGGKTTAATYSASSSRSRRRTARKEEEEAKEKEEMFASLQRPPGTQQRGEHPPGDAAHAAAERSGTAELQAAERYETSSSRKAVVVAGEDSCDSLTLTAGERRKGDEDLGGGVRRRGADGLRPKRSTHDPASKRETNMPEASNKRRNSSSSGKPCVGSMVVFRIHHALADGIALTNMFLSDVFTPSPPKQQSAQAASEQQGPTPAFPTVSGPPFAAAASQPSAVSPRQKAAAAQREQPPALKAGRTGSRSFLGTEARDVGEGEQGKACGKMKDQPHEDSAGRRPRQLQQDNMPSSTPPTTAASSPASSGRYFDGETFPRAFLGSSAKHLHEYPSAADSAAAASPAADVSPPAAPDVDAQSGAAAAASSAAVVSPAAASARAGSCPASAETPAAAAATAKESPAAAASRPAASCEAKRRPRAAVSSSVVASSSRAAHSLGLVAGAAHAVPEPDEQHVSPTLMNAGLEAPSSHGVTSFSRIIRTWDNRQAAPSNTGAEEKSWSVLTAATCRRSPCCTAEAAARTANVFSDAKAERKASSSMHSIKPLVPPVIQPALLPGILLQIVAYLRIPWHVCSLLVLRRDRSWDSLAHLRRQRSGWAHDVHSIRFDLQRLRRLRRSLSAAAAATGTSERTSTHASLGAFSCSPVFRLFSQVPPRMPQGTLSAPLTSSRSPLLHLLMKFIKHRRCSRSRNRYPVGGTARSPSSAGPAASTAVAAAAASPEATAAAAESAAKGGTVCLETCTTRFVDDAGEGENAAAAPKRPHMAVIQWILKIAAGFVWFFGQWRSCRKTSAGGLPPHGRLAAAPSPEAAGATAAAPSFASGAAANSFTINELLTSCVAGGICRYVRAKAVAKPSQAAAAETPKRKVLQQCNASGSASEDAFGLPSFPEQASRVGRLPLARRSPGPPQGSLDARRRSSYSSSCVGTNAKDRPARACFSGCAREASAAEEALSFVSHAATERACSCMQEGTSTWQFKGNASLFRRERPISRDTSEDKRVAHPTSRSVACCSACRRSSARLNASRRASSSTARATPPRQKLSSFADTTTLSAREEDDAGRSCAPTVCSSCRLCPGDGLDAADSCCSRPIERASCSREGNEGASQAADRRTFGTGGRERTRADVSEKRRLAQTPASDGKTTASAGAAGAAASWPPSFTAEANACFREVTLGGDPLSHWGGRQRSPRSKTKQRSCLGQAPARRAGPYSEAATDVKEEVGAALSSRAIAATAAAAVWSEAAEAPATTSGVAALQRKTAPPPPLEERRGSAAGAATDFRRAAAKTEQLPASEEQQVKENTPHSPEGLQRTQQSLLHLNIVVPVNLRTTEEESFQLRNNFTSAVVQLAPADLLSAVSAYERLVKVRARLRRSVRSVGACVFGMMERICFATTPDFTWFLQMWLTNKLSMLLSNVPGPSELTQIHGRQVYMMHFVGSLVGKVGINASAFSYAGNLDLVLHIDRAVLDSPDLLRQCIIDEYRELEQLCTLAWSSRGQSSRDC